VGLEGPGRHIQLGGDLAVGASGRQQLAHGLPTEGAQAQVPRAKDVLRRDAVTARPEEPVGVVAAWVARSPYGFALEPPANLAVPEPGPPSVAASLGLTRREAEVLALVAAGRTNRQIGQELFITPKTAGVHVSRILAKLGVAGRGEAAAMAHRLGLDKQ
jgi:DNA-binding CsgD family transcriptional regulator